MRGAGFLSLTRMTESAEIFHQINSFDGFIDHQIGCLFDVGQCNIEKAYIMALIKCKECGNQVSDSAKNCPQCGVKIAGATGCSTMLLVGLAIFVVIAIIAANLPSYDYAVYQASQDHTTAITKQCASEAGIPANEPKHKITPDEMRLLAECIDRNK